MKPVVTNASAIVSAFSDSVAIAGEVGDARYHVWVDGNTLALQSAPATCLFKNSKAGRGQPGYFRTRRLSTNSKFGAEVVRQLLEAARRDKLVEKARQKLREKDAQAERERQEHVRKSRIEHASGDLYRALEIAAAKLASLEAEWWQRSPQAKQIRAAIAKADNGECQHCSNPAEWQLNGEPVRICQRCLETLDCYRDKKLSQLTLLNPCGGTTC